MDNICPVQGQEDHLCEINEETRYVLQSGDSEVLSDDAESDVSSEQSDWKLNAKRKEETDNL